MLYWDTLNQGNRCGGSNTRNRVKNMDLASIAAAFGLTGQVERTEEICTGNINRTFEIAVRDERSGKVDRYIFQKLNTFVFQHPCEVMDNILAVTEHMKRRLFSRDGSHERRVLSFLTTPEGKPYVEDKEKGFWRAYRYVDHARTYNLIENPYYFRQAGIAFGEFQGLLADFPARTLAETIPHFHDTPHRMRDFRRALAEDRAGRAAGVAREAAYLLANEEQTGELIRMLEAGVIPYRVTHNDTKINNVLFDTETDRAICVIDLDTVMPGASAYDFGDAVRSGASTAEEDEVNLEKVSFSLELFEKFTEGFLTGTAGLLTPEEIDVLPLGARTLTLELAARFLMDYLDGDIYFKVTRPEHNLIRARTQIKLAQDMEEKFSRMQAVVNRYRRM